jgi:hypothetical protein
MSGWTPEQFAALRKDLGQQGVIAVHLFGADYPPVEMAVDGIETLLVRERLHNPLISRILGSTTRPTTDREMRADEMLRFYDAVIGESVVSPRWYFLDDVPKDSREWPQDGLHIFMLTNEQRAAALQMILGNTEVLEKFRDVGRGVDPALPEPGLRRSPKRLRDPESTPAPEILAG